MFPNNAYRLALASLVLSLALSLPGAPATAAPPADAAYDAPVSLALDFKFHIDDDLSEQDVYIHRPGRTGVFRVLPGDRDMKAPLLATLKEQKHNPFDPGHNGPFKPGRPLGLTLGEWLGAKGKARYTCADGKGHLEADFSGLVAGGVYTLWHYFMAMPPTSPFIGTYDLPVGARDGSQSVFRADEEGKARFEASFQPCLQLSGEHLAAGLAAAWHSDLKTWGVEPGPFGKSTHIHLYVSLPPRAGL